MMLQWDLMGVLKKLLFAPFFLVSFYAFLYQGRVFLSSPTLILSLKLEALLSMIWLSVFALTASMLLIIFISLSQNWKYIFSVIFFANLFCFITFQTPANLILAVGFLSLSGLIYVILDNKLKSYLTFQPAALLTPSVKNFSRLLILLFSIAYLINITAAFKERPFEVPDEFLDIGLKVNPLQENTTDVMQQFKIDPKQLGDIKNNQALLKEFGLDPKALDSLTQNAVPNISNSFIKNTLKAQIDNLIAPYQPMIPYFLSLLLFVTLTSFLSIISMVAAPIIWLIFLILEKIGFTKYQTEMREVRKLIV